MYVAYTVQMMDAIPFVSQAKSFVQFACGDAKGAKRTQENFSRQCPGVSQVRSACEAATGDTKAARETQRQCLGFLNDTADADGIPGVGHVKGAVHYGFGDKKGGDSAMKSASRTTGVVLGAAAGFAVGGPVGGAAGGVAGGLIVDGLTTGVDSAVHKEHRPAGLIAQVEEIVKKPKDPGLWFDAAAMVAMDAIAGAEAPKAPKNMVKIVEKGKYKYNKAAIVKKVGKPVYNDIANVAKVAREHVKRGDVMLKKQVITHAKDLNTNKAHVGFNRRVRQRIRQKRRGMTKKEAKRNSFFGPNDKSNVQKRAPNANNVLQRDPRSCAEHHALHQLYEERPSAKPREIRTCTVQVEVDPQNGNPKVKAFERCKNCQEFGDAMGKVPTDAIHGKVIRANPGPIKKAVARVVVTPILAAQPKKTKSPSHSKRKKQKQKRATSMQKRQVKTEQSVKKKYKRRLRRQKKMSHDLIFCKSESKTKTTEKPADFVEDKNKTITKDEIVTRQNSFQKCGEKKHRAESSKVVREEAHSRNTRSLQTQAQHQRSISDVEVHRRGKGGKDTYTKSAMRRQNMNLNRSKGKLQKGRRF